MKHAVVLGIALIFAGIALYLCHLCLPTVRETNAALLAGCALITVGTVICALSLRSGSRY